MAGSDSGSRISVETFVKQNEIAPVRIGLEFVEVSEHGAASLLIAKKNAGNTA